MNQLEELFSNKALWSAVFAWAIAQLIKIILDYTKSRKVNLSLAMSSGGMPSSHSAFVTAMSTSVGLTDGFNSHLFAIAAVVSLVVMYDAAGVRRAAGKQARAINMLFDNFENQGIILDKKLKELLGHSPIEVAAGAILGIVVALVFK